MVLVQNNPVVNARLAGLKFHKFCYCFVKMGAAFAFL